MHCTKSDAKVRIFGNNIQLPAPAGPGKRPLERQDFEAWALSQVNP